MKSLKIIILLSLIISLVGCNGNISSMFNLGGENADTENSTAEADESNEKEKLGMYCARVKKDNKEGVIDSKGNIIFECKYDEIGIVMRVYNGELYTVFELNDKEGVVKSGDEIIVDAIYDNIRINSINNDFYVIVAKLNDKYGLLNIKGEKITDIIYDEIEYFEYGNKAIAAINNEWGIIDSEGNFKVIEGVEEVMYGNKTFRSENTLLPARKGDKWGFININGEFEIEPIYTDLLGWTSKDNDILIPVNMDGKWGYINSKGEMKIVPVFDKVSGDIDNKSITTASKDGMSGPIDKSGNFIKQFPYGMVEWEDNINMYIVYANNLKGVIDKDGKVILEPLYNKLYGLEDGYLVYGESYTDMYGKNQYSLGLINSQGEIVLEKIFSEIFVYDNCIVTNFGKMGDTAVMEIFTKDGTKITDKMYNTIEINTDGDEYICFRSLDGKCGYMDYTGNIVIPEQYNDAKYFDTNTELAAVGVNNTDGDKLYGFIDKTGEFVIPPKFNKAYSFGKSKVAIVVVDDLYGIINPSGKYIIEPIYDEIGSFESY